MPNQDEDTDIQHIARELIARYADEAELIAAGHADTVLDQGDVEAFEIWRNVMIAVHVIQDKRTTRPEYGGKRHLRHSFYNFPFTAVTLKHAYVVRNFCIGRNQHTLR